MILRNGDLISKVDMIRTEIKQEIVEELAARIDSMNIRTTQRKIDSVSAKIDSLRSDIKEAR